MKLDEPITLPPGVVAVIRLPMEMGRFGKVLELIAKEYPSAALIGNGNDTKLAVVWDEETAAVKDGWTGAP